MQEENMVELNEKYIVISVPQNAVEVEITARVYSDGKIMDVSKKMDLDELREAFKDAEENYLDPNATFELTDKGIEYLESLKGDALTW